jgi:hypothetical protein
MAVTSTEQAAEILARHMRESNALRHELGIEGAVDVIADKDGAPTDTIAYSTDDGTDVFIKVEFI